MRAVPQTQDQYRYFLEISPRWNDVDRYGHINNAVFYAYFDTLVNRFLIARNLLDFDDGRTIGLVVETGCQYFAPLGFSDKIRAGLRVAHMGNSSVRYEIGLFGPDNQTTAAQGHFTHVYVDEQTRRPEPVSAKMREVLQELV